MSKYTVASIYPLPIDEFKPGQIPDTYHIDACEDREIPSILVISPGIDRMYVGGTRGFVDIRVDALEIARSVVNDFKNSIYLGDDKVGPGIWYVEGIIGPKDLEDTKEHKAAKVRQMLWYQRLVREADIAYKDGQLRQITDIQRLACKVMGLERPWMSGLDEAKTDKCPACKAYVVVDAIVCATCRTILKPAEYKKLQFQAVN